MTTDAKGRMAAAGAQNLAKYNEEVAEGKRLPGAMRHGAFSVHIRERYSDGRSSEGKKLNRAIEAIQSDFGGPESMTAAQQMILGFLRTKLIVIWQISDFIDRQMSVLNPAGDLLGCLSKSYIAYLESAGRDLEKLYKVRKKKGGVPTIGDIIEARES